MLGFNGGLMALNDRLKLRSMVVGEKDDKVFIASEEAAIRSHGAGRRKHLGARRRRAGHSKGKGRCLSDERRIYLIPNLKLSETTTDA